MAADDESGTVQDVTGRRVRRLSPRDAAEVRRASSDAAVLLEQQVRSGAIPVDPGRHGGAIVSEIMGAAKGVVQELVGGVKDTVQGMERVLVEHTDRLNQIGESQLRGQAAAEASARVAPPPAPAAPPRDSPASSGSVPSMTDLAAGEQDQVLARRARVEAAIQSRDLTALRKEAEDRIGTRVGTYLGHRADRIQSGVPALDNGRYLDGPKAGLEASAEDKVAWERRTRQAGTLRNYASSLTEATTLKEGITKALPGGLVKAAGIAGVAFTAGNKVLDFAESQRAQNDEFRSIYGGSGISGQMDAYGDRLEMNRFRIGNRMRRGFGGGLSEEASNRLFMGTSQLGLQGDDRQRALDLGTENFRKYAMDVEQSLKLITTASENGSHGLQGIAESLEQVTEAAVRGGVNAKVARDNFVQAYQNVAPMFADQSAATAMAAGTTSATAGLGHGFQNVNFGGGLTDPMLMRRVAARQGKTYSEVVMGTRGSEGAAGVLDTLREVRDERLAGQFRPEGLQAIQAAANRARSESRALTTKELDDLALEHGKDLNPDAIAMLLEQSGVTGVDPRNAISTAIASLTGTSDPGQDARNAAKEKAAYEVDPNEFKNKVTASGAASYAKSDRLREVEEKIGGAGRGVDFDFNMDGQEAAAGGARSAYLAQLKRTGKGSGLIEQMLSGGDHRQRFVVKAKNKGKDGTHDRVVNAEEAMKFYSDQLRRGDVKIAAGTGEGMTLAEAYGGEVDESVEITSDDSYSKGAHEAGRSKRNFEKENKDKSKGGGTVLISPSPALERLLRFEGTGSVVVGATTPPTAHVPGSTLPGGRP